MIKVYQLTQAQNNFIVLIPFKGCKVEAKFEKGNVSKGIYARLYTNDKFVQRAVESSEMYGTMFKLVQTLAEPGDNKPKPVKPAQPAAPVATQPAQPKAPVAPAAPEAEPTTPATEPTEPAEADADGKMTFANLAEAIVYIANQYQISVTTESEARNVLKEHGILPVIKRG